MAIREEEEEEGSEAKGSVEKDIVLYETGYWAIGHIQIENEAVFF